MWFKKSRNDEEEDAENDEEEQVDEEDEEDLVKGIGARLRDWRSGVKKKKKEREREGKELKRNKRPNFNLSDWFDPIGLFFP
jgi:hypothetical protein